MPITAIYAALIALLFVVLSFRVTNVRRAEKISLGSGGNPAFEQRIRAHANCAEYAPLALILIGLLESLHAPAAALHTLGATLVFARTAHAYGLSQTPQFIPGRMIGMILTFAVLGLGACGCLWLGIMGAR